MSAASASIRPSQNILVEASGPDRVIVLGSPMVNSAEPNTLLQPTVALRLPSEYVMLPLSMLKSARESSPEVTSCVNSAEKKAPPISG